MCYLGFKWYYTNGSHLTQSYVTTLPFPINVTTQQIPHLYNAKDFKPVNGHGIYTLHDICIELTPGSKRLCLTPDDTVPAKRLVAHNAHTGGIRHLTIAASQNSHFRKWDILQVKQAIPSSHIYITDHPAYFISDSSLENLHHFLADLYNEFYGILKGTNYLGVSNGSYLYFREYNEEMHPWDTFIRYYSRDQFKTFLYALGIRPGYRMFFNETANTCFRNAVFGWAPNWFS